jgi:hypothetical protein
MPVGLGVVLWVCGADGCAAGCAARRLRLGGNFSSGGTHLLVQLLRFLFFVPLYVRRCQDRIDLKLVIENARQTISGRASGPNQVSWKFMKLAG